MDIDSIPFQLKIKEIKYSREQILTPQADFTTQFFTGYLVSPNVHSSCFFKITTQ